jgi:hypothetical protein
MDRTYPKNYDGSNLILIVGAPRSGTTWLQKLLASHPRVRTGQETDIFNLYIGPQLRVWHRQSTVERSGRGGVGLGCYFREDEFLQNLKNYLSILLEPMLGNLDDNEFFLEKTPGHALFIPEIMELMPRARIIHILRDGRDVVASLLAASRTWGKNWAPKQANKAAWLWVQHVRAVKASSPHIPSGQFHELRYEHLFADPLEVVKTVSQFLALPWDETELKNAIERNLPDANAQANATAIPLYGEIAARSGKVVRDPPEFIRKAVPGGWRTDLSLWEKIQVWKVAGKTLNQTGYKW